MSLECPNGHGRQNVVANINVEGKPIRKGDDVHIMKLACGCQVGGPEYNKFLEKVEGIKSEESKAILALKEKTRLALGAAFQGYKATEA
jgi:hypothetical protein